jgi:hypothetical protein
LPGERGCVAEVFSNVNFYDFRKGPEEKGLDFAKYEKTDDANISENCRKLGEMEFHVKCGTYSNILRNELNHGQRLFLKTQSLSSMQKIITINQDKLDTARFMKVFHNGTVTEYPELHIVLFTEDMKGMLERLP